MNDKQNDKPIEMPSRGRPRKKDHSMDSVFNNDFMHKQMFNPSFSFDTSTEEINLGRMCPYNTRDENEILEQFNRIGDVIENNRIPDPYKNKDDISQISPNDIQNNKMKYPEFNFEYQKQRKMPNTFQTQYSSFNIPQYNPYEENKYFNRMEKIEQNNVRQQLYDQRPPSYYTNSRPVLNISNFYKPPQTYMRPLAPYRTPDEIDSAWAYKKKRKSNPILWQYVKNPGDPFNSIIHPSKYSSLDYIQGNDLYNNRIHNEREYNNSILPLYLNSNKELNEEYKQIVANFQRRVNELDFTNVTVHQLKLLMKEFGLNHTGKKNELIDRAKQTIKKIEATSNEKFRRKNESFQSDEKIDEDDYENVFF